MKIGDFIRYTAMGKAGEGYIASVNNRDELVEVIAERDKFNLPVKVVFFNEIKEVVSDD